MAVMNWTRRGLIFKPDSSRNWNHSHAQVPFGFPLDNGRVRIYFATRDERNRSVTTFVEVDSNNLNQVVYVHDKFSLGIGKLGMFDESGAMPSCFIKHNGEIWMYYTGWNVGGDVSYRTAIGLAISRDGGLSFERYSDGPIMDRSVYDPCFACQPFVMKESDLWRMWYLSCTKWEMINNHPEPFYHVKYAESKDGINWERKGQIALDYNDEIDAVGNPTVLLEDGIYKMFYSYRKADSYRDNPEQAYKLGYAESKDGIHFVPLHDRIQLGESVEDWDSIMNAYPHIFDLDGSRVPRLKDWFPLR